ncbi:MAG: hypothetical protein ABI977_32540 [Acidobacteriota bacterium]
MAITAAHLRIDNCTSVRPITKSNDMKQIHSDFSASSSFIAYPNTGPPVFSSFGVLTLPLDFYGFYFPPPSPVTHLVSRQYPYNNVVTPDAHRIFTITAAQSISRLFAPSVSRFTRPRLSRLSTQSTFSKRCRHHSRFAVATIRNNAMVVAYVQ